MTQHPAEAFLEWLYDQGYELISRPILQKREPKLNERVHLYCLDQIESLGMLNEWREAQGETIEDEPDDSITLSA